MMSLAKVVGIDVPAIDLVDIASIGNLPEGINHLGNKAFIIKRFDRTDDGQRIHTEDFAQDRKSTRLTPVTNAHLVCRLLLEKKKYNKHLYNRTIKPYN